MIEVSKSAVPLRDLSDRIKQQKKVGPCFLARIDGRVQLAPDIDKGLVGRGLTRRQVIREIANSSRAAAGTRRLAEAGGREPESSATRSTSNTLAQRQQQFEITGS